MRGKYSLHQRPPTEAAWDEQLVGRTVWVAGRCKKSTPPEIFRAINPIISHRHSMAQQPLRNTKAWISGFMLQDVCRLVNVLPLSTHRPAAAIKRQACPLTALLTLVTPEGKRFRWGDNSPAEMFILSSSNRGGFKKKKKKNPHYAVGPIFQASNVKRAPFLVSYKAWGLAWPLNLLPLSQSMFFPFWHPSPLPFKLHFQVVICHCSRYWG